MKKHIASPQLMSICRNILRTAHNSTLPLNSAEGAFRQTRLTRAICSLQRITLRTTQGQKPIFVMFTDDTQFPATLTWATTNEVIATSEQLIALAVKAWDQSFDYPVPNSLTPVAAKQHRCYRLECRKPYSLDDRTPEQIQFQHDDPVVQRATRELLCPKCWASQKENQPCPPSPSTSSPVPDVASLDK